MVEPAFSPAARARSIKTGAGMVILQMTVSAPVVYLSTAKSGVEAPLYPFSGLPFGSL
jgi:hypothetical protein